MTRKYFEGQTVRLEADFYADDVLTDPTDVELLILGNGLSQDLDTASLTNDDVGKWSYEYVPPDPGDYEYQWRGEGAVVAFAKGNFQVIPYERL